MDWVDNQCSLPVFVLPVIVLPVFVFCCDILNLKNNNWHLLILSFLPGEMFLSRFYFCGEQLDSPNKRKTKMWFELNFSNTVYQVFLYEKNLIISFFRMKRFENLTVLEKLESV